MGTATIDHRGNKVLMLAEELRLCRALKHTCGPNDEQAVPISLLDRTIITLVKLGRASQQMTDQDVGRFWEAWSDQ